MRKKNEGHNKEISLFIHLPVFNDLPVETSVSTFVYKGQECGNVSRY